MKSFLQVFFGIMIAFAIHVNAQTITTIIGGDGYGIPALKAGLMLPAGLAVDADNNLYFVEPNRDQVRMVERATGRIYRIAGTGEQGFSGDGGPAVDAQLSRPWDIVIDQYNNLYIAEAYNQIIRKVNLSNGVITTVAGTPGISGDAGEGGLAIKARLASPEGVALDNMGNLIISESMNDKVKRVDMQTGIISTVAGTGIAGFAGDGGPAVNALLNDPYGIAVDSEGNIFIADQQNSRIRKPISIYIDDEDNVYFDSGSVIRMVSASNGIISTFAGNGLQGFSGDGGPAAEARFYLPGHLAGDNEGNIFVSDRYNERIRIIDQSDVINTFAGNGTRIDDIEGAPFESVQLDNPSKIAEDLEGNLFMVTSSRVIYKANAATGLLERFAGTGEFGYNGDNIPALNAKFRGPLSVDADGEGNLFISDYGNHRIFKVNAADGIIHSIAGTGSSGFSGDGGPASEALLNSPYDIELDADDNIYIVDHGNFRIRKIDQSTGIITTVAGSGTTGSAADGNLATNTKMLYPRSVDVDHEGNLYIVFPNRVRKVDHETQIVETVAGSDWRGYSGDGGLATLAQLEYPRDVDVDKFGNIYIADAGNHAIRRVDSETQIITTIAGNGEPGFYGEDVPAADALLNLPEDVLVSATGDELMVSDGNNGRIRKITGLLGVEPEREYLLL
ncbi:MAG: hypothetical protein P8X57_14960 [Cyclobacteriaceae bacterium]